MTAIDYRLVAGPPAGGRGDARTVAELAEADRLISDLAVLVDAGLVVVQPHVIGPARYVVTGELGDAG